MIDKFEYYKSCIFESIMLHLFLSLDFPFHVCVLCNYLVFNTVVAVYLITYAFLQLSLKLNIRFILIVWKFNFFFYLLESSTSKSFDCWIWWTNWSALVLLRLPRQPAQVALRRARLRLLYDPFSSRPWLSGKYDFGGRHGIIETVRCWDTEAVHC